MRAISLGSEEDKTKQYYLGLSLYMLAALKFKNLDDFDGKGPISKKIAFQVACLAYHYAEHGSLEVGM